MNKNIRVVKPSLNSNCCRRSKHQKKPGEGALAHREGQDSETTDFLILMVFGWYI
jgi:hypothetical protein